VTVWVIPDFGIWGIFLQGEKFWEQKFAHLWTSNFRGRIHSDMLTKAAVTLLALAPWAAGAQISKYLPKWRIM